MPVSSRKTKRVGSQVGAAAWHTTRAAATSGRSCSEGRPVSFAGHVQGRHRAPDRRQTGRRAERGLQLGQGAIRLLRDQRGQSVQVRLQHPAPPVPLDARCDRSPSPAGAASAAAPTTRSRGTSPRRPRPSSRHHCRAGLVLGDPSNRLASVLLHWCMQKYHDEPKQYKGYLKSALAFEKDPAPQDWLWSTGSGRVSFRPGVRLRPKGPASCGGGSDTVRRLNCRSEGVTRPAEHVRQSRAAATLWRLASCSAPIWLGGAVAKQGRFR